MAFTQIGCSSSYQDSLCLQNSSPPTTVLSSNEINRIGDGFLTSVYDKKNSFWKSEVSTSDVVQKQEEQHFSRNPCIHPGQNSEKLELFGRNLLDDKWSHELQHPAVELKETEAKTHENLEVLSSSNRLVGTFNHLSSTSTYHFQHYPNPNHHHHEYPPNYNIPGQHSYQHNRQHAVNSSVLSDPYESANCRQLKGISDLGVTFSGCSEMNLPENTLPLKLNVSSRPSLSSSSSVVSSGSSSSCVQVESQVVNSEFNSNCIGNNTQDFACGSKCEDNLVEYTNCTPYLNKLFSAKILFTNTDRSQHQNHFTGNDKINCISDRSNAISSNQHMNCSTERKSHILHALSSDPPCTSDTTTEQCTGVNDKNTLINDRKYDHFIVDYEKFQPNDHKLLSETSTTRNTQMDVCDQYTLKRKISTGLKEQSLSSLSPMTPILPRECSTIHSLAQVLDSKINSPQSPTNCSSVKESINPNITVSLNGSLLHCTSSIHPSTTNVYSHVLNSPHSKQLSYSRTHPNELSNDHHRFFAQNNANSGPYSFSAKPPQHFFPRHTQNPSHPNAYQSVYLQNGHLRNFSQPGAVNSGHSNHQGFTYGLDGARRKNATRESTTTLKVWLQEHMKNPYPTKGEKIMLAIITKMTLTQVSTWFANARRRLKKENKMSWPPKSTVSIEEKSLNHPNSSCESSINCTASGKSSQRINLIEKLHNNQGNHAPSDIEDNNEGRITSDNDDDDDDENDDQLIDEDEEDDIDVDNDGDIRNTMNGTLLEYEKFEPNSVNSSHQHTVPHSSFTPHMHKDISLYDDNSRNYISDFANSTNSDLLENSDKYIRLKGENSSLIRVSHNLNPHFTSTQACSQFTSFSDNQFSNDNHIPRSNQHNTSNYFNATHELHTVNEYFPDKTERTPIVTTNASITIDESETPSTFHQSKPPYLSESSDFVDKSFTSRNGHLDISLHSSVTQHYLPNSSVLYSKSVHPMPLYNTNSSESNLMTQNPSFFRSNNNIIPENAGVFTSSTDCVTSLRTRPFVDNVMLNTNYLQSNFC